MTEERKKEIERLAKEEFKRVYGEGIFKDLENVGAKTFGHTLVSPIEGWLMFDAFLSGMAFATQLATKKVEQNIAELSKILAGT